MELPYSAKVLCFNKIKEYKRVLPHVDIYQCWGNCLQNNLHRVIINAAQTSKLTVPSPLKVLNRHIATNFRLAAVFCRDLTIGYRKSNQSWFYVRFGWVAKNSNQKLMPYAFDFQCNAKT